MTAQPLTPSETPATRFERLPIEVIEPHPRNVRVDVGDVSQLADSIRAKGLLQPLLVAPLLGGTRRIGGPAYVLIAGHRRRAAAVVAGLHELPCVIRVDLASEADQLEAMLVENLQRTDLTVLEEGDAYQALLELGDDVKRISSKTGRAARTVKDRLAIAHLPEKVRGRVAGGQVTIEQAIALADFTGAPEYEALEQAAGSSNWSWQLRRAQESREAERAVAKAKREAKKAGVTVLPADTEVANVPLERLRGRLPHGTPSEIGQALTPEAHASCPGHVLVDGRTWNGRELYPACTQPDVHPVPEVAPDPEQERRHAEATRERADLETAAAVRRAHLVDVISSRANQVAEEVLRDIVETKLIEAPRWRRKPLHDVLGVPEDQDLRALRAAVDGYSVAQLAVVLHVIEHVEHEYSMEMAHTYPARRNYESSGLDRWQKQLVNVYGYEWSEVEARLLEPPAVVGS